MVNRQNSRLGKALDSVNENLNKVGRLTDREERRATPLQRSIERVCLLFGHPLYFATFVVACICWVSVDMLIHHFRHVYFDEPPFFWLQGIITCNGVLITMAVLIRQNRLAQIEEKRGHLELQVNLLAEQKAAKIIQLLEELRADLPNIKQRHDPDANRMQESPDPESIIEALEERDAGRRG
ncbi:DUF1003 domain-containing protein [Noviherbaspirillum pedocola]|uniref:DUF1003 domain-containing protein n=1 Tax=Noviherbaspirillum pedocola TaxID=2801341 RepID=A0A934SV39_9BURK|nr:DUF1003 domain-containing protein [Noviherbaspirillum pedocola]MBK4735873.1 DUF1003 domain-containing protein [Noviherbaspirillum pedocola]